MDELRIDIKVRYIILIIGAVIIAILSFLNWRSYHDIDKIISTIGVGVGILSVTYLALNLAIVSKQLKFYQIQFPQKNSFEILKDFNSSRIQANLSHLRLVWGKIHNYDDTSKIKYFQDNPKDLETLRYKCIIDSNRKNYQSKTIFYELTNLVENSDRKYT